MSEESCYTVQYMVPDVWNVYFQITFAGLLVILNTFLLIVFLMHRSPVTILLSVLAVTDTLTALFLTIPNVTGYIFFYNDLEGSEGYHFNGWYWERKYPLCAVLFAIEGLIYPSHMISVVVTTLLSIQKALVIRFPRWGKRHLNKAMSFRLVVVTVVCLCFLYIPSMIHGMINLSRGDNNTCCFSQDHSVIRRIYKPIDSTEGDTTTTSTYFDEIYYDQVFVNLFNDRIPSEESGGAFNSPFWSGSGTGESDYWLFDEEISNQSHF